jgi:DNA-binding NarL/FixJ family response regulator
VAKRTGIAENEALVEAELNADGTGGEPVEQAEVLVIDDHELNRTTIVRLLRTSGLKVISTDSAIGATRLVLRSGVSVVVADLNMPAMQGSSLLQVFRRNARLSDIAVVLLSGVSADELVAAASAVGADAAISKLEMAATLVPAVRRLLKRAQRAPQVSGRVSLPASIIQETAATKRKTAT